MKRRRWIPLAVPMLAAALLPAGCGPRGEKAAGAKESRPVPVTVADVQVRPVERTVDAVGTLKGWDEVTVGAKKAGRVVRVRHDIGDRVKPGELLVECERENAELAVSQSENQLLAELAKLGISLMALPKDLPDLSGVDVNKLPSVVEASVALDRAQQNLGRERKLGGRSAGTQQDLQNAENDVRSAEARLAGAILTARSSIAGALGTKVMLEISRQALRDMEIRAPIPSQLPRRARRPTWSTPWPRSRWPRAR